jgi:hypothetical protein
MRAPLIMVVGVIWKYPTKKWVDQEEFQSKQPFGMKKVALQDGNIKFGLL